MDQPLACQRHLFDLPPDLVYLNSAYLGPLPQSVHAAGVAALAARTRPWNMGSQDFFEPAERVRAQAARLLNCDAERVALVPSAANALSAAAKNLHLPPGGKVVVLDEQFPSNVYPWHTLSDGPRTIQAVGAAAGPRRSQRWNDALLEAIEPGTALVAIETAHWTDGTLFDLSRIAARCREVGAAIAIDATQTIGVEVIDIAALQPDLLVAHPYKSMLCNYGLGFAFFGERFAHGEPLEQSWLMRRGSEDFANLVRYEPRYAAGARRFDTSTRVNPVLIDMLAASLALFASWGVPAVRDRCAALSDALGPRLSPLGYTVAAPGEHAANIIGIHQGDAPPFTGLAERLRASNIHVSIRGSAVRVSPHVYNDLDDINRLLGCMELSETR